MTLILHMLVCVLSVQIGKFQCIFTKPYTKKLTNLYTRSPVEPTLCSSAYREPVVPNRTTNQYSVMELTEALDKSVWVQDRPFL